MLTLNPECVGQTGLSQFHPCLCEVEAGLQLPPADGTLA